MSDAEDAAWAKDEIKGGFGKGRSGHKEQQELEGEAEEKEKEAEEYRNKEKEHNDKAAALQEELDNNPYIEGNDRWYEEQEIKRAKESAKYYAGKAAPLEDEAKSLRKEAKDKKSDFQALAAMALGPDFSTLRSQIAEGKAGANLVTGQNFKIDLGANWFIHVGANELKVVDADVMHDITGSKLVSIGVNKKEVIGGAYEQTISGVSNVTVNGSAKFTWSASLFEFTASAKTAITVSVEVKAALGASLTLGAAADAKISGGVSLVVAKSISFENVSGPKYKLTPSDNLKTPSAFWSNAKSRLTGGLWDSKVAKWKTDCGKWSTEGTTASLKGSASVDIEGGKVNVKGTIKLDGPTRATKKIVVGGPLVCKKLIENPNIKITA